MSVRKIAADVAAALAADEKLRAAPGFKALADDPGDVLFEVERAMGEAGVLAVVSAAGFERRQRSGPLLTGTARLAVTVLENVQLNRADGDAGRWSAWRAAERIARALHWREIGAESPLRLARMDRADAENVARVTMEFAVEAVLDGDETTETTAERNSENG